MGNSYSIVEEVNNSTHVRTILFKASVTTGGSITDIRIAWTTNVTAKVGFAAEFSGVGTLSTAGGGLTAAGASVTCIDSKTVPQNGLAIWVGGFEDESIDPANWPICGDSGGNPDLVATRITLNSTTGGGSGSNIHAAFCYALGDTSSDSTTYTGNSSSGSANTDDAGAGGVYNPSASAVQTYGPSKDDFIILDPE